MEIGKKELQKILTDQRKDYENYLGILKEDLDTRIDTLAEGWKMTQEKVDATFEIVGEIKQDIEVMKADIAFIKNELKQKVDRDEFAFLEKRLILLENKFKRI